MHNLKLNKQPLDVVSQLKEDLGIKTTTKLIKFITEDYTRLYAENKSLYWSNKMLKAELQQKALKIA